MRIYNLCKIRTQAVSRHWGFYMQGMELLLKVRNCQMDSVFYGFMGRLYLLERDCVLVLGIGFFCVLPAVNPCFALRFLVFFNFGYFCLALEIRLRGENRLIAFFLRMFYRFDFFFYLRLFILNSTFGYKRFFIFELLILFKSCTRIIIFTFF